MAGMISDRGQRRWMAVLILTGLTGVFYWLSQRPLPLRQGTPVSAPGVPAVSTELPDGSADPDQHPDLAPALPAPAPKTAAPVPPPPPPVRKPVLEFQLPTDNQALWAGQPEKFYMFVDRYTPSGQVSVWEGGCYGFVRNPRETAQGTVFTKFHEGIDIAPATRDPKGEPVDEVRAIADGTVAYVTTSARASNYGNYMVVLHQVGTAGVFYSLYAHLKSSLVAAGTTVPRGTRLGMLGYTGAGIDRRRAHVHLEIGLVLSERFDQFHGRTTTLANPHGIFHGSNLIGLNAAGFLAVNRADPMLMPDQFLRQQEVYYKVLVPNRGRELELADRYPWLRQPGPMLASWEISFTGPGVPVAIAPSSQSVPFPTVSWVKAFGGYHSWNTRSLLGGSGSSASLTAEGNRFLALVSGDF